MQLRPSKILIQDALNSVGGPYTKKGAPLMLYVARSSFQHLGKWDVEYKTKRIIVGSIRQEGGFDERTAYAAVNILRKLERVESGLSKIVDPMLIAHRALISLY